MLSGCKSQRAIETNIAIMRTFAALRKWMQSNKDLAAKIRQLESKYDEQFKVVFDAIRQLIDRKPATSGQSDSRYRENRERNEVLTRMDG
jgi:hypothetical protein